jgi:hypothetical protein
MERISWAEEWKSANITPLFKKGDRSAPVNYRPVSLTSVCSKMMDLIIHSQVKAGEICLAVSLSNIGET